MPKKSSTKSSQSSRRTLKFDDAIVQSNSAKHNDDEVQRRSQKRIGPPFSLPNAKRHDTQHTESYNSPQKKLFSETATLSVVTPENLETTKKAISRQTTRSDYIPAYIHKNVEYVRKGEVLKLSLIQARVLQWIDDNFEIPNDFEQNRNYGPLSGSSYPDRVITAYRLGSLERIKSSDHDDKTKNICTVCADLGHNADTCPTLL